MQPQDDTNGYVFLNIPWRYSGLSARFLGVDPLALFLLPISLIGLRNGGGYLMFACIGLVLAFFVWVNMKGYPTMRMYLQSRAVLLFGRGRWKTR